MFFFRIIDILYTRTSFDELECGGIMGFQAVVQCRVRQVPER